MKINCLHSENLKKLSFVLIGITVLVSCECGSGHEASRQKVDTTRQGRPEERINATRNFLEKERKSIEAYKKDRDLDMERTGTGLHYMILKNSGDTTSVHSRDIVKFNYDIYLMTGELLYSSRDSGPRTLRIDKEDAVMGLHESLKMLNLGDKGRFILPSHLAFGVGGDQNKVPPMTPLVYELEIVNIQKSKS